MTTAMRGFISDIEEKTLAKIRGPKTRDLTTYISAQLGGMRSPRVFTCGELGVNQPRGAITVLLLFGFCHAAHHPNVLLEMIWWSHFCRMVKSVRSSLPLTKVMFLQPLNSSWQRRRSFSESENIRKLQRS